MYVNRQYTTFHGFLEDLEELINDLPGWNHIFTDIRDEEGDINLEDKEDEYIMAWESPTDEDVALEWRGYDSLYLRVDTGKNFIPSSNAFEEHYHDDLLIHFADNGAGDDDVEYWFSGGEDGFAIYLRRNEGDGDDGSCWGTLMEKKPILPYREMRAYEDEHINNYVVAASRSTTSDSLDELDRYSSVGDLSESGGFGFINPDNNFNDYLWIEHRYRTKHISSAGTAVTPVFAYSDRVLLDWSGDDVNHRDIVQADGEDRWQILKSDDVAPVAFSMGD